jgi:hypothetical protein
MIMGNKKERKNKKGKKIEKQTSLRMRERVGEIGRE